MHIARRYSVLAFVLAAVAVSATAFAQAPPPTSMFDRMDTNRDGRISADEHAAVAGAIFTRLDLNHDGRLGPDELPAGRAKAGGLGDEDQAGVSDKQAVAQVLFDRLDANRDGVISEAEMREAHKSKPASTTSALSKTPIRLTAAAAKLDTNHDGFIAMSEHAAMARARFDRMDTNHDGFVSRQEMDAAHGVRAPAQGH